MSGLSSASQMAGQAASKLQENASSLMEKNYHGQLYEAAQNKVGTLRTGYLARKGEGEDSDAGEEELAMVSKGSLNGHHLLI